MIGREGAQMRVWLPAYDPARRVSLKTGAPEALAQEIELGVRYKDASCPLERAAVPVSTQGFQETINR